MAAQKLEFHQAHPTQVGRQTVALIDLAVCSESEGLKTTRIDGALRRLDGLTLLEWCIRRLGESTLVDTVILTGPQQYRERIAQTGLCGARWVPSVFPTPTQRAMEIAERFHAEWIVFASPLCPFTDPTLLDRLISRGWTNREADFVGFIAPNAPGFSLQSLGLVGEMCSARALQKLYDLKLQSDPSDVPQLIRRHFEHFTSKLIPLPEEIIRSNWQFHMDAIEDWERAESYLEAAGEDFCWRRLLQAADRRN